MSRYTDHDSYYKQPDKQQIQESKLCWRSNCINLRDWYDDSGLCKWCINQAIAGNIAPVGSIVINAKQQQGNKHV